MKQGGNNFAFIDSQNLNLNIRREKWVLDFQNFFVYLREKYMVREAFLFIGFLEANRKLYSFLQKCGYRIIFKPVSLAKGETKGNIDAELVLHTMIEYGNFDQAIIVSGDGDFFCLVEYLKQKSKLGCILAPSPVSCSGLLKKIGYKHIDFVSDLKNQLEYKKSS